ncbi:MAG: hypothetical protein KA159_04160 [Halioglobus sp.]|nr:hypothetical protein [Halioglobus sp.]MBP6725083.1 hypothetical protein [Halioglobus sp.]
MQTAYSASLISSVPLQDLLLVAMVFILAALMLLALSVEAGNYPKISETWRQLKRTLQRARDAARHVHEGYRRPRGRVVETPASVK